MLGIDVVFKATPLPELEAFYDQIQRTVEQIGNEVVAYNRNDIIADMGQYPRKAVMPFQFNTAKSKRWYFWAVRTGRIRTDGKHYIRSGGYARGWRVDGEMAQGAYTMTIYNAWNASRYVGGLMNKNIAKARSTQVIGHSRTNWQLSAEKAQKWYLVLISDFSELFEEEIGADFAELNKRRRAFIK